MAYKTTFPIERFSTIRTPFYYYDLELLRLTIESIKAEIADKPRFCVHYAIKANANPTIIRAIAAYGLGVDCVSGGEIATAIKAGFPAEKIMFAGVGKSDWEIESALDNNIQCFNVESLPELDVINQIALNKGVTTNIAFRVNPNVDAHTHDKITTGLNENKFGIDIDDLLPAIRHAESLQAVKLIGLHFHIGSQILDLDVFRPLCDCINDIQDMLERESIHIPHINVGGGLGIDYDTPDDNPIPDFKAYFGLFNRYLKLRDGQYLHFELGRSIVAQCGTLIARTLFVKQGHTKQFAIIDAGMTELVRPAMYGAIHAIQNISTHKDDTATYDVVGPICESSDVFAKDVSLSATQRGDIIAIRSAGAYGETMASQYNSRPLPCAYFSE